MSKPASQEQLVNLGQTLDQAVALHRQGRLDEAEKIYARILKSVPDQVETLQLMTQLKLATGKPADALRLMTTAVAARPNSPDALVLLGHVLRRLKREDEALVNFDKALALEPRHIDALGCRGDALLSRRQGAEALQCFDKILSIDARHPEARVNRGAALAMLGRYEEALAEFDFVLAAMPQHGMALYNRANALAALGREAESLAVYDRVLAIAPQHAVAWNSRGHALLALKRHADAIASFDKAIALNAEYADAHFNRSLALLAVGDYVRGFAAYEWRWKRSGMPATRRNYGRPLWLGEYPLERKTILVHAEQGLGDTIQFARYVPLLARGGASVVVEAPAELTALLARLDGVAQIVARGAALPKFDVQCPLGSLPLAFKTGLTNVPADVPYLAADETRVAKWRPQIAALPGPRVALVWAGNVSHPNDRNRSIALSKLKLLLDDGGMRFVSLQRELRNSDADMLKTLPNASHFGGELEDFEDTAAIVSLCDMVIGVDTAVVHLAAAMGRPTWVLLPYSPDWRWTLDGEHSPWYPAARLFRQPQPGDWASVVEAVRSALKGLGN